MEKPLVSETDDTLQSDNCSTLPVPFDTSVAPTRNDPTSLATSSGKPPGLHPPHHRHCGLTFDKRNSGLTSGSGKQVVMRSSGFSDSDTFHHSGIAATVISRQNHSANAMFGHRTKTKTNQEFVEDPDMTRYAWYWGRLDRQDCERQLKERGTVGNFVVRMNAAGYYVMSFWWVSAERVNEKSCLVCV